MNVDLSIVLALRNAEPVVAAMVRSGLALAQSVEPPGGQPGDLAFEILAMDEGSRDNTLSVLSVLHAQVAQLRTLQDLEPGTALMRGARIAKGSTWLLVDKPFDLDLGIWAVRQVLGGHRAALVPGEVLAVERGTGQPALGWSKGGLVRAQREVKKVLANRGERPVASPPVDRSLRARARLMLRDSVSRVGLGFLDRPDPVS